MKKIGSLFAIVILIVLAGCASFSSVPRANITQLVVEPPWFLVSSPLKYTSNKSRIVVPAGFVSDLASIPKSLWWWQAPHGATLAPAILHDYLYWQQPCTKDEADALLFLKLREVGMSAESAQLVYAGVRTPIGRKSWEMNKEARAKGSTRFFTEKQVAILIDSPLQHTDTLDSLMLAAVSVGGLANPEDPPEVKATCVEAMTEFQNRTDI